MVKKESVVQNKCNIPYWKCKKCWFVFLSILIFLFVSLIVLINKGEGISIAIQDYGLIILSFFAVIAGSLCYNAIDKDFPIERKFVLFLTIGMALRFFGEVLWAYYELVVGEIPLFSMADVAWYLSYIMIILSLSYKIKKTFIDKKQILLSWTLLAAFVISLFLIYVKVPFDADRGLFLSILALEFYVVFDLFVLALILVLTLPSLKGYNKILMPFFFIFLGFISFAVFDSIYAEMALSGSYTGGTIITILYSLAYLLVIIGLMFKYRFIDCQK